MKYFVFLAGLLCCIVFSVPSRATVPCSAELKRCTPSTCTLQPGSPFSQSDVGTDFVGRFLPSAGNKSPAYALCPAPAPAHFSTCTNDRQRSPADWDIDLSNADYLYVWDQVNPSTTGQAYYSTMFDSLQRTLGLTNLGWSRVTGIDYVDIDIAYSTINTQIVLVNYSSNHSASDFGTDIPFDTGNYPSGTLMYKRFTSAPGTGQAWSKGHFTNGTWTLWGAEAGNDITPAHPGALRIHSLTETVGYEYNGLLCP